MAGDDDAEEEEEEEEVLSANAYLLRTDLELSGRVDASRCVGEVGDWDPDPESGLEDLAAEEEEEEEEEEYIDLLLPTAVDSRLMASLSCVRALE